MNKMFIATIVLAIGLLSLSANADDAFPAPEGIVAWWPFDETTGTNAEDIIGGNDGTHINGPTPAPGMVGYALRFDGSNDYVRVPDNDLWNFGSNDFTIEFWASFVPGSPGSIGRPGDVFIGNDQGGGERPKWFFAWGNYRLNFHVNNYGSNPRFFRPRVLFEPSPSQWYHLAITRDGDTLTIFVDGIAQSPTETRSFVIPNANAPLTIGQAEGLGYMNGCLDEMTIYNRALSEEELRGIYLAGSAGKSPVQNQTPVVDGGVGRTCKRGLEIILMATFTDDLLDTHIAWWDFDGDGIPDQDGIVVEGGGSGEVYGTHIYDLSGTYKASVCVQDDKGNYACDDDIIIIVLDNQPPVAICQDVIVFADDNCEAVASIDNGSYDPDGDPTTIDQSPSGSYPLGVTPVTLTVTDDSGATDSCSAMVTVVDDSAPVITSIMPESQVVPVGSPASFTVAATDNCTCLGTLWEFDVPSPDPSDDEDCDGSMSYTYNNPGTYTVGVVAVDEAGNTSAPEFVYVVVYDPTIGGFVTGGGWIESPEGAYMPDPSLIGKANFGFVSKYKKGATAPIGQTEFMFKTANMNFHSSSYDWLVVAGARAMFKGDGTINGAGNYGFMLSAIDADETPSTDVDLFRIKIWDKDAGDVVIYDNQLGDDEDAEPTTAISGGSIIVHKK